MTFITIVYSVCAVIGGTVLACQVLMTILGLSDIDLPDDLSADGADVADGGDAGHAGHHGPSWFVGMLTFRTLMAAVTFFGLAGLAGTSAELPNELTLVVALAAGAGAMYMIHWMMQVLHKLRADGTARIERAVGQAGTVYLRIPGQKAGAGKVHLNLQNRTMEYEAMTSQEPLPVGARVVVVNVIGPSTVEVELVPEPQRISHA
ncbi:MAG: hypothetical protein WD847_17510 [Pirellulales bacterium]